MAFIDELNIYIKAGDGGDGVVRWRKEKYIPMGGPAGGDGGDGGDVYIRGMKDSSLLQKYKHQKEFLAENGGDGGNDKLTGKDGEDLVIDFPIGTVITNTATKEEYELTEVGQQIMILKGGNGGWGNTRFKSSTNQAPEKALPGKDGQDGDFYVEFTVDGGHWTNRIAKRWKVQLA